MFIFLYFTAILHSSHTVHSLYQIYVCLNLFLFVLINNKEGSCKETQTQFSNNVKSPLNRLCTIVVKEMNIDDSVARCQLLEQRLLLERSELKGDDAIVPDIDCDSLGDGSEASYNGSDDSLHKQGT